MIALVNSAVRKVSVLGLVWAFGALSLIWAVDAKAAGNYQLKICGTGEFASGVPPQDAGWGFHVNGIVEWGTDCNNSGMVIAVPSGWVANGDSYWQMDAPAGTRITYWNFWGRRWGKGSANAQTWNDYTWSNGPGGWLSVQYLFSGGGGTCNDYNQQWFTHERQGEGLTSIGMQMQVNDGAQACGGNNRTFSTSQQTIVIRDDVNPGIDPPSGAIASGGWKKGNVTAHVNGNDTGGGLRLIEYSIDGGGATGGWGPQFCNGNPGAYKNRIPCPGNQWYDYTINTAGLPDGQHQIRAVGTEATGSQFSSNPVTFSVDNNSPTSPQNLVEQGGDGWKAQNGFTLDWDNPGQGNGAPIAKVKYQIDSGAVQEKTSGDLSILSNIQLPTDGTHQIKAWLEDAAGNQSVGTAAVETVKMDTTMPSEAAPVIVNGWLNKEELKTELVEWQLPYNFDQLDSLIDGYAVKFTKDPQNDDPGQVKTHPPDPKKISPAQLTDGNWWLITRPISGSGIVGPKAFIPEPVKVDTTAPVVKVDGIPEGWKNQPVSLDISATDALSGIDPALVPSGLTWQVNNGQVFASQGATDKLSINENGANTVKVQATDVAGNPSAAEYVTVKVDRELPKLTFKGQDKSDPTLVRVITSDQHSGIQPGTGQIYYKRSDVGKWDQVKAQEKDGELQAYIPDDAPEGTKIELMATVKDVAGNTGLTMEGEDGKQYVLVGPLRDPSFVDLSFGQGRKEKNSKSDIDVVIASYLAPKVCKRVKVKGTKVKVCLKQKKKKKNKAKPAKPSDGPKTLHVKYGERAQVSGVLRDSLGKPIASQQVDIAASNRNMPGKRVYTIVGTTNTETDGTFSYRLPAGTGRLVLAHYDGNLLRRPVNSEPIDLYVSGMVTFKLAKRRVKEGSNVRIRGNLGYLGEVLPTKGKLVSLQYLRKLKRRRSWNTIKTIRVKSGKIRTTYKASRITRPQKVKLRLLVEEETGWSYEPVTSRARFVYLYPR